MSFADLLSAARDDARSFLGAAIAHRREHPGVYALAHAYAATEYRLQQEEADAEGKSVRAWWLLQRARFHRLRREHFRRRAKATAQAKECECMLRKLDAL